MPELPEVENVVLALQPLVAGRTITKVDILRQELRKTIPVAELQQLQGQTILTTRRRAKWPALVFSSGCLWMHLGMTGRILVVPSTHIADSKHLHVRITLDNQTQLLYEDPRRFGIIAWTNGQHSDPPTSTLGAEPLDPTFSVDDFHQKMLASNKAIKPWLMDGRAIAGVGNIYACEALFDAEISPFVGAKTLTKKQAEELYGHTKRILARAISAGGSTLRDYRRPDNTPGGAQNFHRVYDRAGQACVVCGTGIEQQAQDGRTTFWCPKCQGATAVSTSEATS